MEKNLKHYLWVYVCTASSLQLPLKFIQLKGDVVKRHAVVWGFACQKRAKTEQGDFISLFEKMSATFYYRVNIKGDYLLE